MIYFAILLLFLGCTAFCVGYVAYKNTFSEKETCWGQVVPLPASLRACRILYPLGGIVFLIGIVLWVWSQFIAMDDWNFDPLLYLLVPIVLAILPVPFSFIFAEKWVMNTIQHETGARVLEPFAPVQTVNARIEELSGLEIFQDGIVMYDRTGFAMETVLFSAHGLGNLNAKQMHMLSWYFLQQYPRQFKRKCREHASAVSAAGGIATAASSAAALASRANGNTLISIRLNKR